MPTSPKPPRQSIPAKVREQVLDEYNHHCAICGAMRPQMHHIDEDRTNNDPMNLVPLCPNHHLTDQHHPTRKLELGKLQMFRRFKDPCILRPQFEPLYRRRRFLAALDPQGELPAGAASAIAELIEFVRNLEMGAFYAERLGALLKDNTARVFSLSEPDHIAVSRRRQWHKEHLAKLVANRDEAQRLVVELLVYQPWANQP